jgi:hypothetical protein
MAMMSATTICQPDTLAPYLVGATRGKTRVAVELGVAYGLILLAIWTPNPWREIFYFVTLGWIGLTTWSSFSGRAAAGIRAQGFVGSLWVVGASLVAVVAALLLAGRLHTLHAPHGSAQLVQRFWGYALWSFLQQFLLQDFFLRRLLSLASGKRIAILSAASLFALAHLPNPLLTALTLVWGVLSCMIFLRYRNLFTVGIVHALLGICVAVTVPGTLHHDMKVGLGYLHCSSDSGSHR